MDPDEVIAGISIELEIARFQQVQVIDKRVTFGTVTPQMFSLNNWFTAISSGEIELSEHDGQIFVAYVLSFSYLIFVQLVIALIVVVYMLFAGIFAENWILVTGGFVLLAGGAFVSIVSAIFLFDRLVRRGMRATFGRSRAI